MLLSVIKITERLAYAASKARCKFIYVSSTGIYGSEKLDDPYTEYDNVNPTTNCHRSKWLGEQAVNNFLIDALIIRTGWLFGGNPNSEKNFVARRIEEALNSPSKHIKSNLNQKGVPTYVNDFAIMLHNLIQNNEAGTFNLVNQGSASRFDYVSKIIEIAGLDVKIFPTVAKFFNRKAKVSDNEMAKSLKIMQLGYNDLPFWNESLKRYIEDELHVWPEDKLRIVKN
tara:strand:- start:744 stop:1424 length:681 start_codon:yes stop_codon:yes gene_type:complete